MEPSRIITLLTDFGHRDTYVGQMKGAALAVDPGARPVDLCHDVPAHDVGAGAYLLGTGYGAFPPGTVHVAVVDPGVGPDRRMVAVRAGELVGPDPVRPRVELGRPIRVPVVHVDHFGNVVLDVRGETLTSVLGHPPGPETAMRLVAEAGQVTRFLSTYGHSSGREPFFLINSAGYLEVAIESGRARRGPGGCDPVPIRN